MHAWVPCSNSLAKIHVLLFFYKDKTTTHLSTLCNNPCNYSHVQSRKPAVYWPFKWPTAVPVHYRWRQGTTFSAKTSFYTTCNQCEKDAGMGLCKFTFTFISPLPCLHTFWHAHPYVSFYISNVIFSL